MADANYYEILGVQPKATLEEIRTAYLELAKRVHPDSGGNEALFRSVKAAYETLSDPERRARYDRSGYLDADAPHTEPPAPGWRRTDQQASSNTRTNDSSSSRAGNDAAAGANSGDPPPTSPPAARSEAAQSTAPLWARTASRTLLHKVAANPSAAALGVGVALLMFGTRLGSAAPNSLLAGFALTVVGVLGIAGRRAAATREANERAAIGDLDDVSVSDFERRLVNAFRHVGYTVYRLHSREDWDVDLALDLPGSRTVVQARRWHTAVDAGSVKEVIASRSHYNAHHAIVISTSGFTTAATDVAAANRVETWDRNRLTAFISAQELGPPRTGAALLGRELRFGVPAALRHSVAFLAGMAASSSSAKNRRRRR